MWPKVLHPPNGGRYVWVKSGEPGFWGVVRTGHSGMPPRALSPFLRKVNSSLMEHDPFSAQDPLSLIKERFPYLHEDDMAAVMRLASMRTVSAGEHLIRAGTVNYSGFLVVKGLLRNYHILPDGSERTVLFTSEGGSVASYATVFRNLPTVEQVTAIEETLVIAMDTREMRKLMESRPELRLAYSQVIEQLLLDAITRIDRFVLLSPEERYRAFVKENPGLEQRIPQKHLASYLGITPVSLSRIRARAVRGN